MTIGRVSVVAFLAVSALFACSDVLSPEDFYGVWGADGVRLTLSDYRSVFESPCWSGELAMPLETDKDRFTSLATLTSQGGAGASETRFATFTGRLAGGQLSLQITPQSLGLGPYTLRQDVQVVIPGCP